MHLMPLAALLMQADPPALALGAVVLDAHGDDGADAGKGVSVPLPVALALRCDIPGQQRIDLVDGVALGDLRQNVAQVDLRVQAIDLRSLCRAPNYAESLLARQADGRVHRSPFGIVLPTLPVCRFTGEHDGNERIF